MPDHLTTAELAALVDRAPQVVRGAAASLPGAVRVDTPRGPVWMFPPTAPGGEPWASWWERERRVGRPKGGSES